VRTDLTPIKKRRRATRAAANVKRGLEEIMDEQLRRDMVHKGIARAGQFSWEQSARRVRQIYGEVAER